MIQVKQITIKASLRPLAAIGLIRKLPKMAPNGTNPETKELNKSLLSITSFPSYLYFACKILVNGL